MSVWLQSKRNRVKLRDGRAADDPMRTLVPGEPVYFERLDAGQFRFDGDIDVVAPPHGTTTPDLAAERTRRRRAVSEG